MRLPANAMSRSFGGLRQELAIYIRELETQSQFYTMSGKWLHRQSHQAQFYVPGFIDAKELDSIRPYLPTTDVAQALQNVPQTPQSIPRDIGKPLILKMLDFWNESESAYQLTAGHLDLAHSYLSHRTNLTYATLTEIATILVSRTILNHNVQWPEIIRDEDMTFKKPFLYALHRSLLRNDISFRPQAQGTLRAGGQYEIRPKLETENIRSVNKNVRAFQYSQGIKSPFLESNFKDQPAPGEVAHSGGTEQNFLLKFSKVAQQLIDESRKTRRLTNQGTIGPSSLDSSDGQDIKRGVRKREFRHADLEIIAFIESWVALDSFALHSSLNGTGSAILRATERYGDMDLGPSTGWTFLQEIGIIAPWENRAAFELRIKTSRRLTRPLQTPRLNLTGTEGYIDDKMQDHRKNWGQLPVYCIDDHDAHEIDDGISIEKSDTPDEFWIHIHTADPAAHIDAEGEIGRYAQSLAATVYMPEDVASMLPPDYVQENLSLAPDRPCLTFSAKMNMNGDILEYDIAAGKLNNVLFMTPGTINEVVSRTIRSPVQQLLHKVGGDIPPRSPSRPMTTSVQISDSNTEELQLLYNISQARDKQLKTRGGTNHFSPRSSTSVSFKGFHSSEPMNWKVARLESLMSSYSYPGDPTVQISADKVDHTSNHLPTDHVNIVRTFMLVAGEVASRWCNDRGIPIPFRVTSRNAKNMSPWEYYQKHVLPAVEESGRPHPTELQEYFKMLAVQPSIVPGPHVGIGVEMMAKCTSPLRRFGDLLLHWQVEAALLEEARLGHSLVGNTRDDFLPFSKATVEAFLPHLDTRERIVSRGMRQAERHWLCHFLVRAWLFKEAEIPEKLLFIVEGVQGDRLYGTLPTFLARARSTLKPDSTLGEIKPGDKLEVELEDVNVYFRSIDVKILARLDHGRYSTEDQW